MKKTALILLISLSACALAGEKPSHEKREKELEDALNVVDVPTIEKTLLNSGNEALESGDLIKAEYNYNQLAAKDDKNPLYKFKYAEVARRLGKCDTANTLYEELLKAEPQNLDYQEGKALCLVSQTEFQKAGPLLTDIIAKDKTRWKSINAAGLVFASNKKYDEANQYFDAAAEASNNNPSVMNNQGLVRALIGNNTDAIRILGDAALKANNSAAQKRQINLNLAMIYGAANKMDLAEETAKPYLTQVQLYNNMGIYASLAKNKELARTFFDKALMQTPVYYDRAWTNLESIEKN